MGLLDLVFPKYCVGCKKLGSYLCESCTLKVEYLDNQICAYCYKGAVSGQTHPRCSKALGIDGIVSLTVYKNPVQELIKSLKYRFTTDLLKEFSEKFKFENPLIEDKNWILLPLPLHKSRSNYRGFNQAELLGKVVADKFQLKFDPTLLKRKKATDSQVGLSQRQRSQNVKAAFEVARPLKEASYFVFDDVWTSGATLKEAAAQLKKAGAEKVWGLTLAHPR
ncbi:MAG TPA: double zinc ribbon domain-containing protein [Candidatus Saccharimonadales bacterium]|nr:double zinc ribbon domain-containing protein [Candidatus Saccharimonadales bacterium]